MKWRFVFATNYGAILENEMGERQQKTHKEWWRAGVITWREYRRTQYSLASGLMRDVFERWVRKSGFVSPWQAQDFRKRWAEKHGLNEGERRYLNDYAGGAYWDGDEAVGAVIQLRLGGWSGLERPRSKEDELLWVIGRMKKSLKSHFSTLNFRGGNA